MLKLDRRIQKLLKTPDSRLLENDGQIQRDLLIENMIGGCNLIPYIDYSLCEGCGACAEIYPMFFMMKNDLPWLINHEKFVYGEHKDISNCCPFRAIKIE